MRALKAQASGWHLDIIGSPSDQTETELRAAIAAQDLGKEIDLHVGVSNDRVREILANASLFVSASEYEGFGLVAVEAMSAGLVPVLHENDAFRALAARHPGVATTDFSQAELAASSIEAAFQRLSASPTLRSEMIAGASQHGWAGVCDQHASLYREVLGPRLLEAFA